MLRHSKGRCREAAAEQWSSSQVPFKSDRAYHCRCRGRNAFDEGKYSQLLYPSTLDRNSKKLTWCAKGIRLDSPRSWQTCLDFVGSFDWTIGQRIKSECVRCYHSHDFFQHTLALLTSLLVTEWMQPCMQRRAKRFEFNEYSRPPPSANDLHKSDRCLDMNVLFRIQSHSMPKWREPAPMSAFALISSSLDFTERVSVSSQTYAPWFLQAHFIKDICRRG